jgi:hypothetical protein
MVTKSKPNQRQILLAGAALEAMAVGARKRLPSAFAQPHKGYIHMKAALQWPQEESGLGKKELSGCGVRLSGTVVRR